MHRDNKVEDTQNLFMKMKILKTRERACGTFTLPRMLHFKPALKPRACNVMPQMQLLGKGLQEQVCSHPQEHKL